jgi:hypothetical protein
MNDLNNDPTKRQIHFELQEKFKAELNRMQNNVQYKSANSIDNINETIRIPVAVHYPSVLPGTSATLKNCLRTLAQTQIDRLNMDYNGTNPDRVNWTPTVAAFYPMVSGLGSMDVEFVLATRNHPAASGIANGTVAVTFGTDFLNGNDYDSTWNGYINIVVRYADGNLGYSPLGGYPGNGMTVVIDTEAFGSGNGCTGYVPGAPFNLGRTLTHELGHFFNLDHTFSNSCGTVANCATTGDMICDTPAVTNESYNCPAAGSRAACHGQKALTMNYMDYVNDACMYMFTPGQVTRMQAWYETIKSTLKTNVLANNDFIKNNVSIYPNPNKGEFNIKFNDLSQNYSIEIIDISGRVVFEENLNELSDLEKSIKIDNSSTGLYFVKISSGGASYTQKILVQ